MIVGAKNGASLTIEIPGLDRIFQGFYSASQICSCSVLDRLNYDLQNGFVVLQLLLSFDFTE